MTPPGDAALPAFEPLAELVAMLARTGVRCVLGGSGLLHAHGLIDEVRDWDLQTDARDAEVRAALGGRAAVFKGGDALHADSKLTLSDAPIEVICRFAFFTPGGVVRLPAVEEGTWRGIPLASTAVWAVAYALLATGEASARRHERSERLFARLAERGVDPALRGRLLAEPLPGPVATRLAALAPRPAAG